MHPCFRLAKRPVLRRMDVTSSPGMTETEHSPTPAIFTLHAIRRRRTVSIVTLAQESASKDLWAITTSAQPYRRVMAEAGIVSLTQESGSLWPQGPNASGNALDNPRTISATLAC